MSIKVGNGDTVFLLNTANTSYAMEKGASGRLQHIYWGKRLDRLEDLPVGEQMQYYPFDQPSKKLLTNQEYVGWGGYLFDEPCLKALFADGCRDLDLRYQSYKQSDNAVSETLVITLRELVYNLEVDLYYRIYKGLEVLDRWSVIRNTGTDNIMLENAQSAVFYMPRGKEYRLTHMSGKWAAEYALERINLTQSKVVVESRNGVSGPDSCPWVAVDYRGQADEESGRVWAASIHWPGNWKFVVEVTRVDQVRLTGGINDFDFSWKLHPGEEFTTPKVSAVYSEEGFGGASNAFHRYLSDYLAPQPKAKEMMPALFNSWEVFEFDINMKQQFELAKIAARLGIEFYVVDDGWFGQRDHDRAGLGDWYPSKTKFPDGLDPLINHVNSLGMEFGIWVEPEMVNRDSDLFRAHPDWIMNFPRKESNEWRNQLTLNFARQDVSEWAWGFLDELLGQHNIKYLKWDMNRYFSEPGWPEKPVDEQREIWVRYAQNILELFSRIQEKYPKVILENCSSGGARIDLSMAHVSDMVNPSDNVDPLDNMKIFEGYTQVFLPRTYGRGIGVAPNGINGRVTPIKYRAYLGMLGTFIAGDNLFKYTEVEIAEVAGYIKTYKEIRETTQNGDMYRLESAYNRPWAAFEFVRRDKSEAVMFVFGQSMQFRKIVPRIRLRGLDPESIYKVKGLQDTGPYNKLHLTKELLSGEPVKNVYVERSKELSGKMLMQLGVEVALAGDFDCLLFKFSRVK
ncbi:MAG: alpha-galactosidase [Treponema sp.]|jgi:alpha-galactosidase|nr:alpha-galactosidase [Treponema sp.]